MNAGAPLGETVAVRAEALAPERGGVVTPLWLAFHNGGFDAFDEGAPASPGLANLSQNGVVGLENTGPGLVGIFLAQGLDPAAPPPAEETVAAEFAVRGPDGVQGIVATLDNPLGLVAGTEDAVEARPEGNRFFGYGAVFAPPRRRLHRQRRPARGRGVRRQGQPPRRLLRRDGAEVCDSGSEVNDENPMNAPLTLAEIGNGEPEGAAVALHPGLDPQGGLHAAPFFANADVHGEGSGVRLFSGVEGGSRFTGLIENAGHIRSEATTGILAGVLVEPGVSFAGAIRNAGTLEVPFALDAGETEAGLRFVQEAESRDGHPRFDAGGGRVEIAGGELAGVVHLGAGRDRFDARGAERGVIVEGGAGSDRIVGSAQDDRLDDGGPFDALTGGEGAGTFVFDPAPVGNGARDALRVSDFEAGVDAFDFGARRSRGCSTSATAPSCASRAMIATWRSSTGWATRARSACPTDRSPRWRGPGMRRGAARARRLARSCSTRARRRGHSHDGAAP